MSERWVTTVVGKGALFCFYGAFLCYVSFVILPRVLPDFSISSDTGNKREYQKADCPMTWKHPNSTETSSTCYVYPENLMNITPPTFLKSYKNPCWSAPKEHGINVPIRCLPYFFLIGAPKCGTTDLNTRLLKHPQLSGRVKKEIHWFTRKRFVSVKPFYEQLPTFYNYTYQLRLATEDAYFAKDNNSYHNKIFGDSSVSTLWDESFAVRFELATDGQWPVHSVPKNIHHLNPGTKFVSIIRDPVERLYSDYLYFAHGKVNTKEHFHYAVQKVIESSKRCLKPDSIKECVQSWPVTTEVRILIGLYHIYFKEYYDFFPKEQILVMKLEEFSSNVRYYMEKVFKHLELDPVNDELMDEICDTSNANTRRKEDIKLGGMFPETRKLLQDFYRPYNNRLGELLGPEFNYNTDYDQEDDDEYYQDSE